jgi:hypothetical protein
LDLLTFANSTIVAILPSANEQAQFILDAKISPGFDISTGDLSTYASFEALLDHFNPLPTYVGAYVQTVSAAPYPSGSLADFLNATTPAAFPGGSKGVCWRAALGLLASAIPAICFSAKLQAAVSTAVDDPTKKASDVVNQIATLG